MAISDWLFSFPSEMILPLHRFFCDVPDEFLFAPTVNLMEIAKAVKIGDNDASSSSEQCMGLMHQSLLSYLLSPTVVDTLH